MEPYILNWQEHGPSLAAALDSLRTKEAFLDVFLETEGGTVGAHKLVLCSSSAFFEDYFMKGKANQIFLLDVDINVLRALVSYMYTGVAVIDPSYIHDFIDKGRRFKVQGLQSLQLTVGNLFTAVESDGFSGESADGDQLMQPVDPQPDQDGQAAGKRERDIIDTINLDSDGGESSYSARIISVKPCPPDDRTTVFVPRNAGISETLAAAVKSSPADTQEGRFPLEPVSAFEQVESSSSQISTISVPGNAAITETPAADDLNTQPETAVKYSLAESHEESFLSESSAIVKSSPSQEEEFDSVPAADTLDSDDAQPTEPVAVSAFFIKSSPAGSLREDTPATEFFPESPASVDGTKIWPRKSEDQDLPYTTEVVIEEEVPSEAETVPLDYRSDRGELSDMEPDHILRQDVMLGGEKQPVVLVKRVSSDYNQNSATSPPQLLEERFLGIDSHEANIDRRSQVDRNSASTPQKQVGGQLSEIDGESGSEKQVKHANRNEDSVPEGYVSDRSVRPRRNSRKRKIVLPGEEDSGDSNTCGGSTAEDSDYPTTYYAARKKMNIAKKSSAKGKSLLPKQSLFKKGAAKESSGLLCPHCGRSFSRNDYWRNHLLTVCQIRFCTKCQFRTRNQKDLKDHQLQCNNDQAPSSASSPDSPGPSDDPLAIAPSPGPSSAMMDRVPSDRVLRIILTRCDQLDLA